MAVRRDGAVEIGQRLAVTQRTHLGHEPREQVEGTIGLGDEAGERLPPVAPLDRIAALDERAARGIGLVGWRQKSQRRIIKAPEMSPRATLGRAPWRARVCQSV